MKKANPTSCKDLKDEELLMRTLCVARVERRVTLKLLNYLVEIDSRRLYATVNARSSLFEYLISDLGLSHAAASDRVNTVRLIRALPEVKEHLETGKLSVTTAAQIQRFANTEQRAHVRGKSISIETKREAVEACLGQSKLEVEKTLLEIQSEPARTLTKERSRLISSTRTELRFSVEKPTLLKLNQLKDLIGNSSLEAIFDSSLDALIILEQKKRGQTQSTKSKSSKPNSKKTSASNPKTRSSNLGVANPGVATPGDASSGGASAGGASAGTATPDALIPAKSKTSAQESFGRPADEATQISRTVAQLKSRFIPIDFKRLIFNRSKGRCEYIDPRTKARCKSTYKLQIDHIFPLALGGKTESSNLRHLCSIHNLRAATGAGLRQKQKTVSRQNVIHLSA